MSTNYENLSPKAQRMVESLKRSGLSALFTLEITHRAGCQGAQTGVCTCRPKVERREKFPGVASLTEDQQRQLATFTGAGVFDVEAGHDGRLVIRSQESSATEAVAAAVTESAMATTVALNKQTKALESLAEAARDQTLATLSLARAVRQQTAELALTLEKPEQIEFKRDKNGKITSAKKKPVLAV